MAFVGAWNLAIVKPWQVVNIVSFFPSLAHLWSGFSLRNKAEQNGMFTDWIMLEGFNRMFWEAELSCDPGVPWNITAG